MSGIPMLFVGGPVDGTIRAVQEPLHPTFGVVTYASSPLDFCPPDEVARANCVTRHDYQLDLKKVPVEGGWDVYEFYRHSELSRETFDYSTVDETKCHFLGHNEAPSIPLPRGMRVRAPDYNFRLVREHVMTPPISREEITRNIQPHQMDFSAVEMNMARAILDSPNSFHSEWQGSWAHSNVLTGRSSSEKPNIEPERPASHYWWGTALTIMKP